MAELEDREEKRRKMVVAAMEDDRISNLPDEILVTIISLLPYLEASRTCILSKRWKFLWTFSDCLTFNYTDKRINLSRGKFVNWVTRALRLRDKNTRIKEFIVSFPLTAFYSQDIDTLTDNYSQDIENWLMFFLTAKKQGGIERLVLDCAGLLGYFQKHIFNDNLVKILTSPSGLCSIKSIKQLTMTSIGVTDEVVEHFLSNCPCLERLEISYSMQLVKLKVKDTPCLKFLAINHCYEIENLYISVPSMVSLSLRGLRKNARIDVEDAVALVDLAYKRSPLSFNMGILPLSTYLSQLETLYLHLTSCDKSLLPLEMPNLKKLTLDVLTPSRCSIRDLAKFIESSPSLQSFTLKCQNIRKPHDVRAPHKHTHKYLKVVEFVRYIDMELACYFLQNAVFLDKIIIDSCVPQFDKRIIDLISRIADLKSRLPRDDITIVTLCRIKLD